MSTLGLPGLDEPLLERDGELKAVSQLLSNARAGRGRLLLLEAHAGMGKSTLIEHAAASARDACLNKHVAPTGFGGHEQPSMATAQISSKRSLAGRAV